MIVCHAQSLSLSDPNESKPALTGLLIWPAPEVSDRRLDPFIQQPLVMFKAGLDPPAHFPVT
jgi:hypothetical protein